LGHYIHGIAPDDIVCRRTLSWRRGSVLSFSGKRPLFEGGFKTRREEEKWH
jgi:hypothetical protein